jgi:hypothetical protein
MEKVEEKAEKTPTKGKGGSGYSPKGGFLGGITMYMTCKLYLNFMANLELLGRRWL